MNQQKLTPAELTAYRRYQNMRREMRRTELNLAYGDSLLMLVNAIESAMGEDALTHHELLATLMDKKAQAYQLIAQNQAAFDWYKQIAANSLHHSGLTES